MGVDLKLAAMRALVNSVYGRGFITKMGDGSYKYKNRHLVSFYIVLSEYERERFMKGPSYYPALRETETEITVQIDGSQTCSMYIYLRRNP